MSVGGVRGRGGDRDLGFYLSPINVSPPLPLANCKVSCPALCFRLVSQTLTHTSSPFIFMSPPFLICFHWNSGLNAFSFSPSSLIKIPLPFVALQFTSSFFCSPTVTNHPTSCHSLSFLSSSSPSPHLQSSILLCFEEDECPQVDKNFNECRFKDNVTAPSTPNM